MGFREFKEYSAEEIGLWLIAGGLGEHAPKFLAEGVDGDLLLTLTIDDIKNDLGLSGLQAKKLMKNIEFSKNIGAAPLSNDDELNKLMAEVNELDERVHTLQSEVDERNREIAQLQEKMSKMHVTETRGTEPPSPVHYSPAQAPPKQPTHTPAPSPASPPRVGRRKFSFRISYPCRCVVLLYAIVHMIFTRLSQFFCQNDVVRQIGVVGGAARGAAGGAVRGAIGTITSSCIPCEI
jgi:hypothetical protein